MPSLKERLFKLEQHGGHAIEPRTKWERDAAYAAWMRDILPIAALCNSPEELANHLRSRKEKDSAQVVSLDSKRSNDAVLANMARSLFRKSRDAGPRR